MELVYVESRMIECATIVVHVYSLRANEKESRVLDTLLSLYLRAHGGRGQGEQGRADPTPRPDTPDPTPRPDPPTPRPKKEGSGFASGCKGMQRGKSLCKRMQGDASEKARR